MKNDRFDASDVKRVCERKLKIEFNSTKEYNGWYWLDGKKVVRITVPKGRKFLPPGTYSSMARQMRLSTAQFDNLLECPLSKADYDATLRAAG